MGIELNKKTKLKSFFLDNNEITDKSAYEIGDMLTGNVVLEKISLCK